jgi:hypothetical protein
VETPPLQKLMRHESVTTPLKYYVSSDAASAAADIDAALHRSQGNTTDTEGMTKPTETL